MRRPRLGRRIAYAGRLARLLAVLAGFGLTRLLSGVLRRLPGPVARLPGLLPPAEGFRALLEALGGTFVKLGQVLSLQPDIVPREYCDELFDLLDRMPPFDFAAVEETFRADLGRPPGELFDEFEARPFASASIGQVHRARLGERRLAVKVLRPTAWRDFGGDIGLMKAVVWLIETLRITSLEGFALPIREFIAWTGDELDYRTEARYMAQVRRNTDPEAPALVPGVVAELSTARILAVDYVAGTTLLEYLRSLEKGDPGLDYRLRQSGFDPDTFAENIIDNFLGDVFRHGLFHADLHPANLLVLPGNVVGYVDFGITGVISEYARQRSLEIILALARGDVDGILEGLLAVSEITDDSDVEEFSSGVRDLADEWFEPEGAGTRAKKSYTLILLDMIKLSRRCLVLPHEEALRYMRSVITVDGLVARFAPGFDVNDCLERLSREHLRARSLEAAFSADRFIETWIAGSRLLRDGAERLDRLLDRLEERRKRGGGRRRRRRAAGRKALARRSLRLGTVVFASASLVVLAPDAAGLGLNLVTAQLAIVAAGIVGLLWTGGRWLRSS